jgi:hypothetical protein
LENAPQQRENVVLGPMLRRLRIVQNVSKWDAARFHAETVGVEDSEV